MTNLKTTKRALLSSVIALLVCFTMLLGTTFAWFTDEAKSAGNTIQAGTLDIVLEKYTNGLWEDAENKTIAFKTHKDSDVAAEDILWEPGCTYWMEHIRVRNNGTLALKYEIALSDITGDPALLQAIEFTYTAYDGNGGSVSGALNEIKGELLPGQTSGDIIIKAHMKEDAGNECQGKMLEKISVVVFAQQLTYEYDSLGNQYDAMVTPLKGGFFHNTGSRTQIGIEVEKITGITDKNSFYIDILDQDGNVISKITPTEKFITNNVENGAIKGNGATACCIVYGDDSSSWDNTAFVPTMDQIPTTAVLYLNGAKAGECKIDESRLTWQEVVDGYTAPVNP